MRRTLSVLALAVLALTPAVASAQHAGYTLFGKPNPEGLSLAPERKAVHPISAPYFHEDSFVTTDLRAWYAYHNFSDFTVPNGLGGGEGNVYALQARLALTDTLQLVAYKDGYTDINAGQYKESGWNDLAAGLKWNFLQDWKHDLHAAAGAGYQFAIGDPGVLQNDQELRLWASINKGFDRLHLGATVNYLQHTGSEDSSDPFGSSDRLTFHLHADYYVCKWFSPVLEANGYFVTDKGTEVLTVSGADIANLGGGSDLITGVAGFEVRPFENFAFRVAYETDLTGGESLFGYRWTFSAIYSF